MSQDSQADIQRIACPASLRTRLNVFRVGHGDEQHYRVADEALGAHYTFEPWQFFVLEVLPKCENFAKLASAFQNRFGKPLAAADAGELFARVAKHKLFSSAVDHPLIAAMRNRSDVSVSVVSSAPVPPSKVVEEEKNSRTAATAPVREGALPAGVCEVVGMDESVGDAVWKVFNPAVLLKILHPVARPFGYAIYILPLILVASFYVLSSRFDSLVEELRHPDFVKFLLLGMVIQNVLVTWVTALVAHGFRAAVRGWCIHFWLPPSFTARIDHARNLSRRERIWLHASPLLARMGLFAGGVLLWFSTGTKDGIWASVGLAVGAISAVSFIVAANPLLRSSAYHLISAYLEEPNIRRRSRQALVGKLRGGSYAKVDSDVLTAYSLASVTYAVAVIGILLLVLGRILHLELGAFAYLPLAVVGVPVAWRMIGKFNELGRRHDRQAQFQRWRKGDLPKGEVESDEKARPNALAGYSFRAVGLMLLVGLFLPMQYEIGGRVVVLPQEKQDVTSEVSGIIESINFDGGEFLPEGTVIGRLSCTDYAAQVKILTAKIAEQEAVAAELKSRPRPEEVELAESNLRTEITRAKFSKEELARMEKLHAEKTVSFEDLEDVRREHELDVKRVAEKRANVELIKAGATPDEIAAAEAKLQSWEEERRLYLEKIEKSVFHMPIEGTLVAMHLKQKVGSYFERGQPLAVVENTEEVIVQVDVAEEDIRFVQDDAKVRVRFPTYSNQDIEGIVTLVGPTVTEGRGGGVLQTTARIDNRDGRLKSGMEGYAKISSESLPVWKALTLGAFRFFNVEAWSWLP